MRQLVGLGLVASLLLACSGDEPATYTQGNELKPYTEEYRFGTGFVRPGTVLLYTAGQYQVLADVTLESVELLSQPTGIDVRAARIVFLASEHRQTTSPAGAYCVNWPVADFGPSHEVKGLKLRKGEAVSVNIYAAAGTTVGEWNAMGLRLRYRDGSGKRREVLDPSSEIGMKVTTTEPPQCGGSPSAFGSD